MSSDLATTVILGWCVQRRGERILWSVPGLVQALHRHPLVAHSLFPLDGTGLALRNSKVAALARLGYDGRASHVTFCHLAGLYSRADWRPMSTDAVRSPADLYDRYAGVVFGYLLRLSADRALADDLTGETFYRALLALDGFRGEASLKTWLLHIARNLYLRRCERERRVTSLDALEEQGMAFPAASDPENDLLRDEKSRAIKHALRSLSESDRSLLLLAADEDMSCGEIAQVLEISLTAVKVRLYRARRRLADALCEE